MANFMADLFGGLTLEQLIVYVLAIRGGFAGVKLPSLPTLPQLPSNRPKSK